MSISPSVLYIGIMSGTSVDGIDLALVRIQANRSQFIAGLVVPFAQPLREQILQLCADPQCHLATLGELAVELSRAYGQGVLQLLDQQGLTAHDIRAIGCHGQTLYHQPNGAAPFSMQLINAPVLAATCGITTISDFRSMDIALGGQGAPLVPLFHHSLMADCPATTTSQVFLNIGGIANVSILKPLPLQGFDTGPGNVLMDAWAEHRRGLPYDKDGALAAAGQVDLQLLQMLLQDPYFQQPAPKSTGREHFNLEWLQQQLTIFPGKLSDEDIMATLVALTAASISNALQALPAGDLWLCGGGANNPVLISKIAQLLPDWQIRNSTDIGVHPDFMEAIAFAWLAYRTMTGQPSTEPMITGGCRAELAGQITPLLSHPLHWGE
ncbi:MAG: anhydro-N-acetylmuramic acid kinase [Ferrimonas sp.]